MPLTGPAPALFHQYFAAWLRLEPRARSADLARGLEARTADPLWMLGRQWQLGEYEADDAGSPIDVEVTHHNQQVTQYGLRNDPPGTVIPASEPLEALVERQQIQTDPLQLDWRARVQIGQQFERLLRANVANGAGSVITDFRSQFFPVTQVSVVDLVDTDRSTRLFRAAMAGRAVDGGELLEAIRAGTLPLPGGPADADIQTSADQLVTWYEGVYPQPALGATSAWQGGRLDHRFQVRAPHGPAPDDATTLVAPSYRNGELDWYSYNVASAGVWPDSSQTDRYPPSRVMFGGMPHPRWWAFEDHRTDFGAMDVATPDLAKLMLMEFALVYGDDWFVLPLVVPANSVTQIQQLKVVDVFGIETTIDPARNESADPSERWEMYTLSAADAARDPGVPDFLYVPPAVGFRDESPAWEEVRFLRDEGANMVWGVEHTVLDGVGRPVDGLDAHMERAAREREAVGLGGGDGNAPPPPDSGFPPYHLATIVPANWIPFLPTNIGFDTRSIRLRRGQMLRVDDPPAAGGGLPPAIPSLTRLLDPSGDLLWLDEEAVLRAGLRVQLTMQRARWTHGETVLWLGWKVTTGRGEGSSGLRFDVIADAEA